MSSKIVDKFKILPLYIKSLFFGCSMSFAGLFFNWFSSVDSFENGINFNAFSGPAYLSGYIILIVTGYSILVLLKYLKENSCEFNQLKKYYVEKWSGIITFILSIQIISVYLSEKFLNTVNKEIEIGFFITFAGSLITILGTILFKTKKCDNIGISEKQLNLNLDIEKEHEFNFKFHTEKAIEGIKGVENPVLKEQIQKQKEIAAKINNK